MWGTACRNLVRFSFWTNKQTINEREPSNAYAMNTHTHTRAKLMIEKMQTAQLIRNWHNFLVISSCRILIRRSLWWCATAITKKMMMTTTIIARLQFLIYVFQIQVSRLKIINAIKYEQTSAHSRMCTIQFYICCCLLLSLLFCEKHRSAYFIIACPCSKAKRNWGERGETDEKGNTWKLDKFTNYGFSCVRNDFRTYYWI